MFFRFKICFVKKNTVLFNSHINVFKNSPKISHITKRDILELNFPQSYEKYDNSVVVQISKVFGTP